MTQFMAAEAMYKYGYCNLSTTWTDQPQENKENLTSGKLGESETDWETTRVWPLRNNSLKVAVNSPKNWKNNLRIPESQEGESESDPFEVSTDKTFSDGVESLSLGSSYGEGPDYYEVPSTQDLVIKSSTPTLRFMKNWDLTWFSNSYTESWVW